MWLVFCWTRYSCGNTQNTQNWGQPFPVHSTSSSCPHCFFPAWFFPSLSSIGADFFLLTVILVSMWTAGMLTVSELWCWAGGACGLDKMDLGRRRVWGDVRKMSGCASYISLSRSLCPTLAFYSADLWVSSLLVSAVAQSAGLSVCFVILFTSFFFSSFPLMFPPEDIHIRTVCLGSTLVSIMEKVNLVWSKGVDS